jgi:hypothetical protein
LMKNITIWKLIKVLWHVIKLKDFQKGYLKA